MVFYTYKSMQLKSGGTKGLKEYQPPSFKLLCLMHKKQINQVNKIKNYLNMYTMVNLGLKSLKKALERAFCFK